MQDPTILSVKSLYTIEIWNSNYFIRFDPSEGKQQTGLSKNTIKNTVIDTLITSKTRIKLLLKFFLNPGNSAYLRGLENEFGESTNAIRLELNRFEEANMLKTHAKGNKKIFSVNEDHPLYSEIHGIVRKYFGLDVIVDRIAKRLGNLKIVYLTGDIARGKDSGLIDLVLVGNVDQQYLLTLINKSEKLIKRKIRYLIYEEDEFNNRDNKEDGLLLMWGNGD